MTLVQDHARALHVLLVTLAVALSGCEDQTVDEGGVFVGPAPRLPAKGTGSGVDPDAGPRSTEGIAVAGRVATHEGVAIAARPIDLLDSQGRRIEAVTDRAGAFRVEDVAAPYDLAVAADPSSAVSAPTVYLGLEREDPWLELFEPGDVTERPNAQLLRVAVLAPRCTTETCRVAIVSASPSGSGAASASYAGDGEPIVFEIEHEWNASPIPAKETISVHVLTSNADHTFFSYARRHGIPASGGEPTDIGTMVPEPVASSSPLIVRAIPRGVSASWASSLGTWLDLPDGASMSLTYATRGEETLRLPLIPGASFRAGAWMQHPPVQDRPYFQLAAQSWSGKRRLAGGSLGLDVLAGPAPVRPSVEGTLSRRGAGIAWKNGSTATSLLTELTLTNVTRGVLRYRVWTMGEELPFAKLELLGLARPQAGEHVLGLTSTIRSSLEALVDPDPAARRQRFDAAFPGAASHQRFRFRVTQ